MRMRRKALAMQARVLREGSACGISRGCRNLRLRGWRGIGTGFPLNDHRGARVFLPMNNPIHSIRKRLSPSTIIATAALVAAMGGTAYAADVIIDSPDELGDDVVTQRSTADDAIGTAQLKDRAVTQLREAHPHLRARVAVNGAGQATLLAGDVNTFTGLQRIQKGQVRVTFDTQNTLGVGRNLSTCAFTATPEAAFKNGTGPLKKLRVYTSVASGSSVDVFTLEDRDALGEEGVDASFSLVADC
jgi:hypothetical protein